MFYTNRRASMPGLRGVAYCHATRIGIAASRDGAHWAYQGVADLPYGDANTAFWAPEILEHNGIYHMFVSVVPGVHEDWSGTRDIIHLTSGDLNRWEFESKLDLASDRVIDAAVMPLANGLFRLWYKDENAKDGAVHFADSHDLKKWDVRGVALPGVKGEGPKVFRWKGSYWMIADLWEGFGVYRSDDCLRWTPQADHLLKEPGTLPTDRFKGNHADVVVSGDRAYLFYFVHQQGADAAGKDENWPRRTFIQVAELREEQGRITCDRNQQVRVVLTPPEPTPKRVHSR